MNPRQNPHPQISVLVIGSGVANPARLPVVRGAVDVAHKPIKSLITGLVPLGDVLGEEADGRRKSKCA